MQETIYNMHTEVRQNLDLTREVNIATQSSASSAD